jgi:hypothetical protein
VQLPNRAVEQDAAATLVAERLGYTPTPSAAPSRQLLRETCRTKEARARIARRTTWNCR